ncbi:hypothetical protein [Mucilaginibacter sp. SP1R1]|uniref:hypothetical protein n=1 Tax=Mucilaginibacter sp. SP1R1 TaxID=2723091 RepID=UPI003AFFF8B4
MKQLDVFKKIGGILKELNDQYDYLEAESSDLNELELELFVANAHFLKDHAEILRRLHERGTPAPQLPVAEKPELLLEKSNPVPVEPEKKPELTHEPRYFEPVVQQKPAVISQLELTPEAETPVQAPYNNPATIETIIPIDESEAPVPQIDLASESKIDSYSFEQQIPEPVKEELVINDIAEWEDEDDQFEQEELTEQLPPVTAEAIKAEELPFTPVAAIATNTVVEDDHKTDSEDKVLTINQKISALKAEKEKAPVSPTNLLPITDLKSAINLNDKLLYIKDLFNGYSLAYSEAVEIVNRFNSFEEAERFLKTNYVVKNNWDSKPTTTQKFYELLKRRYPAN